MGIKIIVNTRKVVKTNVYTNLRSVSTQYNDNFHAHTVRLDNYQSFFTNWIFSPIGYSQKQFYICIKIDIQKLLHVSV